MAPEHPDVARLAAGTEYEQQVHDYVNRALTESVEVRGAADKPKTGVPLGRTVTNPVTREQIPMFVADYVLMEYGTGAIMGVPAHDQRDYDFAVAFGLEIRQVVEPVDGEVPEGEAFVSQASTSGWSTPGSSAAWTPSPGRRRSSTGSTARARDTPRSTTGCVTGWCRDSATGAVRSRSSTAMAADGAGAGE